MRVHAPAKINLTLEVLAGRADGYHGIRSVMQAISLSDALTLSLEPGTTGLVSVRPEPEGFTVPTDESNLICRAARALAEATPDAPKHNVKVGLTKRIPVGAGLGGGSSDAACVLRALNRLWGLHLPAERLVEIAASVGSDVPFFLTGGTALAEGRGEILTPLPPPAPLWFVVAKPDAGLSTPAVYRRFDELPPHTPGDASTRMAAAVRLDAEAVAPCLHNDLQEAAFDLCPQSRRVRDALLEAGALAAMLSGSGSAVFGLVRNKDDAHGIRAQLSRQGIWVEACRTVAQEPE